MEKNIPDTTQGLTTGELYKSKSPILKYFSNSNKNNKRNKIFASNKKSDEQLHKIYEYINPSSDEINYHFLILCLLAKTTPTISEVYDYIFKNHIMSDIKLPDLGDIIYNHLTIYNAFIRAKKIFTSKEFDEKKLDGLYQPYKDKIHNFKSPTYTMTKQNPCDKGEELTYRNSKEIKDYINSINEIIKYDYKYLINNGKIEDLINVCEFFDFINLKKNYKPKRIEQYSSINKHLNQLTQYKIIQQTNEKKHKNSPLKYVICDNILDYIKKDNDKIIQALKDNKDKYPLSSLANFCIDTINEHQCKSEEIKGGTLDIFNDYIVYVIIEAIANQRFIIITTVDENLIPVIPIKRYYDDKDNGKHKLTFKCFPNDKDRDILIDDIEKCDIGCTCNIDFYENNKGITDTAKKKLSDFDNKQEEINVEYIEIYLKFDNIQKKAPIYILESFNKILNDYDNKYSIDDILMINEYYKKNECTIGSIIKKNMGINKIIGELKKYNEKRCMPIEIGWIELIEAINSKAKDEKYFKLIPYYNDIKSSYYKVFREIINIGSLNISEIDEICTNLNASHIGADVKSKIEKNKISFLSVDDDGNILKNFFNDDGNKVTKFEVPIYLTILELRYLKTMFENNEFCESLGKDLNDKLVKIFEYAQSDYDVEIFKDIQSFNFDAEFDLSIFEGEEQPNNKTATTGQPKQSSNAF